MKNFILASLIVLALLGLGYIQYRLLQVGLLLEKGRFDRKMELVLQDVNALVDRNEAVRNMLLRLNHQEERPLLSPEYLLPRLLNDSLAHWIDSSLLANAIAVDFTFMVTEEVRKDTLVQSDDFDRERYTYEKYQASLGGKLVRDCFCRPILHVHVNHLFSYLLRQLAYLIIPSVFFILVLAISLGLLIHYLRRQQKLDEIKNDFINNLTHELKTPVFSISLLTKMLREKIKGAKEREYLQLIDKENKQVQYHIEKVLELASLESGKYQLQPEATDVHLLLKELVKQYQLKARDATGRITLELRAKDHHLFLDTLHFRNTVQNLLENAVKYSKGTPQVTLVTESDPQFFCLRVQDEGIGIASEHQKRVFEKFYRVSTGDLHEVKGFGLGLSYVRQIVLAHQGHINLKSRPGAGAEFIIHLPLSKKN